MSVKLGIGLSNWESSNGSTELIWNIIYNAESQGWDSIWFSEHHFSHEGMEICPNALMLSSDIAARTKNIRIGQAANIITFWNPIRVAEDIALLDNFSWGTPDKPDRLGGLVRAAQACYDIALTYGTPFISGKDSLYNEYRDTSTGEQLAIPGTLLISAISVIDDVDKAITMDTKLAGNLIYVIGQTYDEIGGSHYTAIHNFVGNSVPVVRPKTGKQIIQSLNHAIDHRLIRSCHDCSEGGIGVACAEMAFAGGFGMDLDLSNVPRSNQTNADDVITVSYTHLTLPTKA